MELNLDLLKKVCETPGISGFEDKIRKLVKSEIETYADKIEIDNIGNLIFFKKGKDSSKRVMISAHMDEIGFMVNHIDKDGFLRFFPIGGFDPKTLTSQRVIIHGNEDVLGVLGSKPIHIMTEDDKKKTLEIDSFFIDVGMEPKKVEKLIPLGSPVSRQATFAELGDCVTCKSLDNRVSVYILIEVIKKLKTLPYDSFLVFTTQEEVGLRGAKVAALNIKPDFGINLDTGIANDTPSNSGYDKYGKLGEGTAIKKLDRSVICDTRMVKFLEKTAQKHKIKYQNDIKIFGGTDTSALQLDGRSIAGALSTVTRYLHQTIETVHKSDIAATISLIKGALEDIDSFSFEF